MILPIPYMANTNVGDVFVLLVLSFMIWIVAVRCLVMLEWFAEKWMDL